MICKNCGKPIRNGSKFCGSCGADCPFDPDATQVLDETMLQTPQRVCENCGMPWNLQYSSCVHCGFSPNQPQKKKKKRKPLLIIIIIVLLIAALAAAAYFFFFDRNEEAANSTSTTASKEQKTEPGETKTEPKPEPSADANSDVEASTDSEQTENPSLHSYEFVISNCSWWEAQKEAVSRGGYLANFDSEEEYQYVLSLIESEGYGDIYFRIGARREEDSESFYWVNADGELFGESLNGENAWCLHHWLTGEPTFVWKSKNEYFLEIFYSDKEKRWVWNDIDERPTWPTDATKLGYIIEYDFVND